MSEYLPVVIAAVVYGVFLLIKLVFAQADKTKQQAIYQRHLAQQAEAEREAERCQAVHLKFQKEYEQKKQALGKIVCHQCNWTGNWGEGMSYEEFFVYELVQVHQCQVSHNVDTNLHYLNSETQYKCPMCKSPNWQKV